jgi:hypothetical protein
LIDVQAVTALVFNRIMRDPEALAVRNALGAWPDSVISADDLGGDLPARPFLALREGAVQRIDRIIDQPLYTWWIYDDPQHGYWRINGLAPLIAQAYDARKLWLPSGAGIGLVEVGDLSAPRTDTALGLVCKSIRVAVRAV